MHGDNGFGSRNWEGELILEFADSLGLVVANTWFIKRDKLKVTYESGGCKSVVDYMLVRATERSMLRDVKVIVNEPSIPQHKLLICVLDWRDRTKKRRDAFVGKLKVWKLKEGEIRREFKEKVEKKEAVRNEISVEGIWNDLKTCMLEVTEEVCGKAKAPPRQKETWWWNDEVKTAVDEKRILFLKWKNSKQEQDKKNYSLAKNKAKKVIARAQEEERQRFVDDLEREDRKGNIFRVAKKMTQKNRDVVGTGCVKGKDGKVVIEEEEIRRVWKDYYSKLLNEEFNWDKDSLDPVDPIFGPSDNFSCSEIRAAILKAKNCKAAGPSGVVSDMLKASDSAGVQWVTDLCNAIVRDGAIPSDWRKSLMVNVYKGKGDALECGSYRGIKLTDHVMKVLERVIEKRVRNIVDIDDMQFGFRPGRGTTDAMYIVRQVQERFLANKKELWIAFVDLEKAFDRVPREVVWWSLRKVGVDEWLINMIKAMYVGTTTAVKGKGGISEEFEVKVGVHQGSVLSPLLFTIVLEALSREFREGLPWELLYADDLALLAESEELLIEKINRWKGGMERKGLKVNMGKTKILRCQSKSGSVLREESGKYPCGVCKRGVGKNSIFCSGCNKWVHKKCSKLKGKLRENSNYRCVRCLSGLGTGSAQIKKEVVLEDGGKLELVDKFCYLGDMLGSGGGVEEASRMRVRCAWAKFKEHSQLLTKRGVSLKIKGKIYQSSVQRALVYGSETWALKVEDEHRLERTENMMIRWMCGVTLRDRCTMKELRERLGLLGVSEVVRRGRLAWFGHVERKEENDWVSRCRYIEVVGRVGRGRPVKTWQEVVNCDMRELGLSREMAQDRVTWRSFILGKPSNPCKHGKRDVK